ncbi:MAG TPA: hypothetical protein IAB59_02785 [Candidatus Onthousia faecipullorum]|uniref:Uncharacterized protein n=1 Tax=Candidatus Onthousia faecipullorum TaxID=2840887 RepID=A0A9D1KBP3_9FIRM|nr:hypothetical protein [Candidatus Onthousia faecipullorum]
MIVLDENRKLIINKLEVSNSLSSSIIKKYNFNNMRKEFHDILDLMQENYFNHVCYQEFLKYNIDEELNFIVIEDPNYTVESVDKYGRNLKQDLVFRIFSKEMYKQEIILCENLLYRVRDSYNNLDEVEKFIIKNFEFMNQSKYTDETLMDELLLYKDKYYDLKKSAYIKMGLQLNLDNEKRTDDELREYFINYLSKYALVTFEN